MAVLCDFWGVCCGVSVLLECCVRCTVTVRTLRYVNCRCFGLSFTRVGKVTRLTHHTALRFTEELRRVLQVVRCCECVGGGLCEAWGRRLNGALDRVDAAAAFASSLIRSCGDVACVRVLVCCQMLEL